MGSSDLGQRARLETAEVCSRGQRGRFNSGGPRPLVKQREMQFGAVCRLEREVKLTEGKRRGRNTESYDSSFISLIPKILNQDFEPR